MAKANTTRNDAEGTADTRMADAPVSKLGNRRDAYARLAKRYDEEAGVMLPTELRGLARRLHVRACLIEDHSERIDERAEGTDAKFVKLAKSRFSFFRGTALLFYRDMAGADPNLPSVMLLGDVHPENFGIMPNEDNVPIFSVNDFDEATYGPFSWDLKRGAAGFSIAAKQIAGLGKKHRRRIVGCFVRGYVEQMRDAVLSNTASGVFTIADSPPIIRKLFAEAMVKRQAWLEDRYLDETGSGFRTSDELTPVSSRRAEFQSLIDRLAETNGIERGGRLGDLSVKDVAIRHGQGTASLGLDRYYVLVEGPARDASDDVIVEFKRARRSALSGLVPENPLEAGLRADRIAHGHSVHLAHGDVFYDSVEIDGQSFMTRERAPFRDDIDLDDLSKSDWRDYAHVCGRALAMVHARSALDGEVDYELPRIVEAIEPVELFIDDIAASAQESFKRVKHDHRCFRRDHSLDAFKRLPQVYR